MVRKISKDKYIIAGVITAFIFILGLTLGFLLESYRSGWIEEINKNQDNNFESLQLQYLYLNSLEENNNSCVVLHATLKNAIEDLSTSLSDFTEYEEDSQLNQKEFKLIGRKYLLDNIRYWFFAETAKKKCNLPVITVLYFYSDTCVNCPLQGTILTYYRKIFDQKVLVFPLNVAFEEEPMLKILISQHNITTYPTVIVNGEKYAGLVNKEKMKKIICESIDDENC